MLEHLDIEDIYAPFANANKVMRTLVARLAKLVPHVPKRRSEYQMSRSQYKKNKPAFAMFATTNIKFEAPESPAPALEESIGQ
jgi:hypothetical protein